MLKIDDKELIEHALAGGEYMAQLCRSQIAHICSLLGPKYRSQADFAEVVGRKRRRNLTAEARKKIALAQKRRWAAWRKAHK